MKILAISGSLRKNSFNTGLILAAIELKPEGMDIEYFDIKDIPLYNQDIDGDEKPGSVSELAKKVGEADGILVAVPEYNYSFTAALKNAFDWLSRLQPMPLSGKPLAMMGASYGMSGTMRAQLQFRQVMIYLDVRVLNKPEVLIPSAYDGKFSENGDLVDEQSKKHINEMLIAFEEFVKINTQK